MSDTLPPRPRSSLDVYLDAIQGDPLLTPAEECALAEAIARGDREARARMIRANLRLVVKIARHYVGRGLGIEDLIGEGNVGLIRAAEQFDPRFGTRFSTYAAYWIKQAIRQALTNTVATIRLPAHVVNLLGRWRRAERALWRELGREPGFDRVADELGLAPAHRTQVACALNAGRVRRDGDAEGPWSGDEPKDPGPAPDQRVETDEEKAAVLGRLERLDDRERLIVVLRYGLGGEAPLTLHEVGTRLGVTREWIRKIELRAVQKLEVAGTGLTATTPRTRPRTRPLHRHRARSPLAATTAC